MTDFQKAMIEEVEKVAKMTETASEEERQFLMLFAVDCGEETRVVGQGSPESLMWLFSKMMEDDDKKSFS